MGWVRGSLPSTANPLGSQGPEPHEGASLCCGPLTAKFSRQLWASLPLNTQEESQGQCSPEDPEEGGCLAPQHKPQREPLCLDPQCVERSPLSSASILGSLFSLSPPASSFSSSRWKLYLVWSQGQKLHHTFPQISWSHTWNFENLRFWFHDRADTFKSWSLWSGQLNCSRGASEYTWKESQEPRTEGWVVRTTHWLVLQNDPLN